MIIRHINTNDRDNWQKLFLGYAEFYKVEINASVIETVWSWLHDQDHEVNSLVVETDNTLVAFAHYRRMPSPLRGKDIGFLDDLYVSPDWRGNKISEKIIDELKIISKQKNWNLIRWITRDDNLRAKKVYDKVANLSNWDVYELD